MKDVKVTHIVLKNTSHEGLQEELNKLPRDCRLKDIVEGMDGFYIVLVVINDVF